MGPLIFPRHSQNNSYVDQTKNGKVACICGTEERDRRPKTEDRRPKTEDRRPDAMSLLPGFGLNAPRKPASLGRRPEQRKGGPVGQEVRCVRLYLHLHIKDSLKFGRNDGPRSRKFPRRDVSH
jgi:hypothetical protein